MTTSESVHRMIDDLPADLRQEAIHYIEEVSHCKKMSAAKKFSLAWARGLPHLKQHNIR